MKVHLTTALVLVLAHSVCPAEECPAPQSGRFANPDGGYEFVVPKGLSGYWASPCASTPDGQCTCLGAHGLTMPLSSVSYLSVFSGYAPWRDDAEESVSDAEAFISFEKEFGSEKSVRFSTPRQMVLHGRTGTYLVKNYEDTGVRMQEKIYLFVVKSEVSNDIVVSLVAPSSEIETFEPRFEELLDSLSWLPTGEIERPSEK